MALGQMPIHKCPPLLDKLGFGDHVRKRRGGKHRYHIHEMELCMKMLCKIQSISKAVSEDGPKSTGGRIFVGMEEKTWDSGMTCSLPNHREFWLLELSTLYISKDCALLDIGCADRIPTSRILHPTGQYGE